MGVRLPTVATKLLVPSVPRDLIARKRLLDVLDRGIAKPLVLLAAPAGAGKTVLLASWVRKRKLPGPVCWLTLDGEDRDGAQLASDLLSGLRGCGAVRPGGILDRLALPRGAGEDRFLPLLVNGLAELSTPVVVVLDEVPEPASHPANVALDYLVRHAPEQCRLVIAGRSDPPLPLQRLRLSDSLTELRCSELAFDREETAELCRRLALSLSETEVGTLWKRTEGWAAAVRLAALTLQDHPRPERFVADLMGTDRAIADYLAAEVLAQLSPEQREFVLRTSLVETIGTELADTLTESHGAALKLAALEHAGMPVLPVSERRGDDGCHSDDSCYRYHPLFRELLQAHLRVTHPQEVAKLHRLAAGWYAEHRQTTPAIRHALAGEDWRQASGLIAEHWLDLFLRGYAARMGPPLSCLPAALVATDPRLGAALAAAQLQDGDIAAGENQLEHARHSLSAGDSERSAGPDQASDRDRTRGQELEKTLTAVGLHLERLRGHAQEAERSAARLRELEGRLEGRIRHEDWSALRSFTLSNLGATHLWCGAPAQARPELLEALALATEYEFEPVVLDCLAQLALVDLLGGSLRSARERAQRALALVESGVCGRDLAHGCADLAAAAVAFRCGELERAEELANRLARTCCRADTRLRVAAGALHAVILGAAGPKSAERGALKLRAVRALIAEREGDELPSDYMPVALADAEARVLGAGGEYDAALQALARARAEHPRSLSLLVRQASIELRCGAHEAAMRTLAPVMPGDPTPESLHEPTSSAALPMLIEGWLLRALLEHAYGERRRGARALERALALTEREPYHEAFLLNGPFVGGLLEHQAEAGTAHPAVLEVLLQASGQRSHLSAPPAELLTEREQTILRYLPTLLSNAEIGAEIFVSLNTVKTHLRGIYRKLGVSSRADAVERARQSGLLPSGVKRPQVRRGPAASL
jgi:LuxR family transcriptional regulator, maltose regulon positive regulatory protein